VVTSFGSVVRSVFVPRKQYLEPHFIARHRRAHCLFSYSSRTKVQRAELLAESSGPFGDSGSCCYTVPHRVVPLRGLMYRLVLAPCRCAMPYPLLRRTHVELVVVCHAYFLPGYHLIMV
jgi:hypothetical protein